MDDQYCPLCLHAIKAPKLSDFDDYFTCSHCQSPITYNDNDLLLYAIIFIALFTIPLVLIANTNPLIALLGALVTYHLIRPKWIEPHLRLQPMLGFPQ